MNTADIELVIKISQEAYDDIKEGYYDKNLRKMAIAIGNGTPLPKGHGRLIDENKISNFGWDRLQDHAVVTAPTIIEADKIEPTVNGDWHYGSEPMQSVSYSDRTTIIKADKENDE